MANGSSSRHFRPSDMDDSSYNELGTPSSPLALKSEDSWGSVEDRGRHGRKKASNRNNNGPTSPFAIARARARILVGRVKQEKPADLLNDNGSSPLPSPLSRGRDRSSRVKQEHRTDRGDESDIQLNRRRPVFIRPAVKREPATTRSSGHAERRKPASTSGISHLFDSLFRKQDVSRSANRERRRSEAKAESKSKNKPTSATQFAPASSSARISRRRHTIDIPAPPLEESRVETVHIKSEDNPTQYTIQAFNIDNSTLHKNVAYLSSLFHERLTKRILPMDARQRLHDDRNRCVAPTAKEGNPRCRNRLRASHDDGDGVLRMFSSLKLEAGNQACLEIGRYLIDHALCGGCHRRAAMCEFNQICKDLDKMSAEDRRVFDNWIKALLTDPQAAATGKVSETVTSVREIVEPRAPPTFGAATGSPRNTRRITRSMAGTAPSNDTTGTISPPRNPMMLYFQTFKRYEPRSTVGRETRDVLRDLLRKPLTKQELAEGSIYMYWFPGNFGYLKIGKTSGDQTRRLSAWEKQCKHKAESLSSDLGNLPHVYRVEALVHAALKEVRYCEENCKGCGRRHVEWFQKTVQEAYEVYKRFADFMRSEPYVYTPGAPGTGYTLRADITEEHIERLCEPFERKMTPSKAPRQPSPR